MSSDPAVAPSRGPGRHPLTIKPERIDIGSDMLVRNDTLAREHGVAERTLDRGDARGSPYVYIGGVKYRPLREFNEFVAASIVRRGSAPTRRRRGAA
jgi:hypothetical protein